MLGGLAHSLVCVDALARQHAVLVPYSSAHVGASRTRHPHLALAERFLPIHSHIQANAAVRTRLGAGLTNPRFRQEDMFVDRLLRLLAAPGFSGQ